MFVLVVARQDEEQSAGEGFFSFGGGCVKNEGWFTFVGISTQGNDVCVGGCKST